jgi:hypothetical protein
MDIPIGKGIRGPIRVMNLRPGPHRLTRFIVFALVGK